MYSITSVCRLLNFFESIQPLFLTYVLYMQIYVCTVCMYLTLAKICLFGKVCLLYACTEKRIP